MDYAEALLRKWEKADPRDRWRYGLGKRPPEHVRNGPLSAEEPHPLPAALGDDSSTIRPDHILHEIPVHLWTAKEREDHLRETFRRACDRFPEIMEPYIIRISDLTDWDEVKLFMRYALAETISARFPLKYQRAITVDGETECLTN